MIKVAFFDLGETLIHDGRPFPGVADALGVIDSFRTAEGRPLALGIVSDYLMPAPPPTEAKIAALEGRYREEFLVPSGLFCFFEPFESRVTLSTRAGAFKPDRKVFDVALARSGAGASMDECLFVTENRSHLDEVARFGIKPVRFGPGPDGAAGFEDWADAPAVIARLVAPDDLDSIVLAIAPALAARHGILGFAPDEAGDRGDVIRGRAGLLVPLDDARLGPLRGVHVELPTEVAVRLGRDGKMTGVTAAPLDPDAMADAADFVSSLVASKQVAIPGGDAPAFGVTHAVETDSAGRTRLVRLGYSSC